jgi:hypothetical protein
MPWKESRASDERLKFIAEVLSDNASNGGSVPLFRYFAEDRIHVEETI